MLTWLGVALGVAVGSALFPLISVELFLVGMVTHHHDPHLHYWLLGAVIAIGQVLGKLLYFYAGRGAIRLPNVLGERKKKDRALSPRGQRWQALRQLWGQRLARLRDRCEQHPSWMIATTGVSSVVGLPPFAATTVLAGVTRMPPLAFITTSLLGRFVRFTAIAASPALLLGLHA